MSKRFFPQLCICISVLFISCKNPAEDARATAMPDSKQALKESIKKYPDSLMLVQKLIESYRDDGEYKKAIAITDNEIKRNSGNAYLWNMKATLHFENSDTAEALNALEHAVSIYPLPEYLIALGTVYAEVKNRASLEIADSLLSGNYVKYARDAFFLKGLYNSYIGNKRKAISYFDSSLNTDFTYMPSYREKAIALYDLGKYEEALMVLKRAVTVQNNFEEGHYWMGKCFEKLHMPEEAMQSYQHALLYDKNFIEAKEALAKLMTENK